nr:MAG TPA: hypothetical protein [Caudoviricetes sp.]
MFRPIHLWLFYHLLLNITIKKRAVSRPLS